MHILTITIHSNLFGREVDDDTLEIIAREFFYEFDSLAKDRGIRDQIKVEAYWQKGCVLEHLMIIVENPEVVFGAATVTAAQATLQYKKLKENLLEISKDLKNFSKIIAGVPVTVWHSLLSMTKPSDKANKLSLVPIETEEQNSPNKRSHKD